MPVDPDRLNQVGDLVLTEPGQLRALADPLRLRLFDLVSRRGPLTAAALVEGTGAEAGLVEDSLQELASNGLVDPVGDGRWTTVARGIYFEIPDEPEAQQAARELSNVMLAEYSSLPEAWAREEEPRLGLQWARAAGMFNARVDLTPDELREIQARLERLLEPFANRTNDQKPAGAATVRILSFFLPSP
jgi:DNA-binding transcriptional ArsR family regulator